MNTKLSQSIVALLALMILQAIVLYAMGQPAICACGEVKLWFNEISGPENSKHLTDFYTYTHVLHGIAFYLLVWFFLPRLAISARFIIAIFLEVSWELIENTPMIIDRYREQALAAEYTGDSIVNSLSDTVASVIGFLMAWKLRVTMIVTFVLIMEVAAAYVYRDNLTLNILQLIYPSEAISTWQSGG